ncbi:hypothetical protein JOQ06_009460 [Pogonophryne albipinna]|uniref:Uncharacterized protein n=1 Tax=Pogonophryne albipinna TaxID=1090488 RepID=A0AAD6BQZ2_9TELE|nr:hypothetical protein JOQ06_009460 [Pogonophryne albipinna]
MEVALEEVGKDGGNKGYVEVAYEEEEQEEEPMGDLDTLLTLLLGSTVHCVVASIALTQLRVSKTNPPVLREGMLDMESRPL